MLRGIYRILSTIKEWFRTRNEIESTKTGMNIEELSDEQCLKTVIEFLENRVGISTGFVPREDGVLTHQVVQITCGEFVTVSTPQPLEVPLRFATAEEQGILLN